MKNNCLKCCNGTHRRIVKKYKDKIYTYDYTDSKFCSPKCYHLYARGKPLTGKSLAASRKSIEKAVEARKNNPLVREKWLLKMKEVTAGSKNVRWIVDRSKLANQDERNCYEYTEWSQSVRTRDNFKCRIDNDDCSGRIEVHHILSWREHPELHYKLNNGITLCHAHHPRVRSEEKRLIPEFQKLVSVSNV
jgi:hypothetical protein